MQASLTWPSTERGGQELGTSPGEGCGGTGSPPLTQGAPWGVTARWARGPRSLLPGCAGPAQGPWHLPEKTFKMGEYRKLRLLGPQVCRHPQDSLLGGKSQKARLQEEAPAE